MSLKLTHTTEARNPCWIVDDCSIDDREKTNVTRVDKFGTRASRTRGATF